MSSSMTGLDISSLSCLTQSSSSRQERWGWGLMSLSLNSSCSETQTCNISRWWTGQTATWSTWTASTSRGPGVCITSPGGCSPPARTPRPRRGWWQSGTHTSGEQRGHTLELQMMISQSQEKAPTRQGLLLVESTY